MSLNRGDVKFRWRERERERETDRQTDRQIDRHTNRDRQRERDRETERQRERDPHCFCLVIRQPRKAHQQDGKEKYDWDIAKTPPWR